MTRLVLIAVAIATSLFVAGCGSKDTATESISAASSSEATSSSAAATTSAEAEAETDAPDGSVNQYLEENGVTRIHILANTPDVPQPDVTLPAGWSDIGGSDKVWGSIALTETKDSPDPAMILIGYSKFDGEVDQAKLLQLAPNTVTAMPDYEGPETATPIKVSGFDAVTIAGKAVDEGKPVFVGVTEVMIPRQDGVYEMLFMAHGPVDQEAAITQAMSVLNNETRLAP